MHTAAHFKKTEPYYVHRDALLKVTEKEVEDFEKYINQASNCFYGNAKAIVTALKTPRNLVTPQLDQPPAYSESEYVSKPEVLGYEPIYLSMWRQQGYSYELPVAHPVSALSRSLV